MTQLPRCPWCQQEKKPEALELYRQYHDNEWGVPCRDDKQLFEFLILESAQAGLAWITILRKRENYRRAFDDFDVQKVACYNQKSIDRLMNDAGIVRNRLKIESAISNAKLFIELQKEFGSFSNYWWGYVDNTPIQNQWESMADVPATTPLSDIISKDMKKRGFRFFGSTICYANMQATGMVNDHIVSCYRHRECGLSTDERRTRNPGNQ